MSIFDAVMIIEDETADEATVLAAFQSLIDKGAVWQLQGSYRRMAENLIANGLCTARAE